MKDVPFLPLYAANILASRAYKLMSFGERGLWISITMECSVNGGVPADFKEMGKILGFPESEIKQFFSKYQTVFFENVAGQLISTELNEDKKGYENTGRLKSEGGKKGVKNKREKQEVEGLAQGQPAGSLSCINSTQINSNHLMDKRLMNNSNDALVSGYGDAPDASYMTTQKHQREVRVSKEMKLDIESRSNKLTPKQKIFVAEYPVDQNAAQAAMRAGYSKKTARQIGFQNLNKPQIVKAIQESMSQRAERTETTGESVFQGIWGVIRRSEAEGEEFKPLFGFIPTSSISYSI